VIVQNGKYGFIDHDGKIVIQPQFLWARDFWRGLGTVYVCGRYLSIDSAGTLLPLRIAIDGKLEVQQKGDKFGFVDSSGQFGIAPTFDEALPFSEGLAAVRSGDKWGFIDTSGNFVIQPRFTAAYYFREGVSTAELDSDSVLIDRSGAVLASQFQYVDLIAEGRVPVTQKEKSGYLDLAGKAVIPLIYDGVSPFSEGLAAVEQGKKWGYVNRDGKLVIPAKFDQAEMFGSGLAAAKFDGKSGFIDKSGEFAFFLAFDAASGFLTGDEESNLSTAPTNVSAFWIDHKFGYVNTAGTVIWGPVNGVPDHPPLFGWSKNDKVASCDGIPESTKARIASFPGSSD